MYRRSIMRAVVLIPITVMLPSYRTKCWQLDLRWSVNVSASLAGGKGCSRLGLGQSGERSGWSEAYSRLESTPETYTLR